MPEDLCGIPLPPFPLPLLVTRAVYFDELSHVIHPWEWVAMYPILMARKAVKTVRISHRVTQLAGLELEFSPGRMTSALGSYPDSPSLPEHWF